MTMIDYGLMATSDAAILMVVAYWWRRAPEMARIVATEVGWYVRSFFAALYVCSQLASSRPFRVVAIGMFALCAIWMGVLLPIFIRRGTAPAKRLRRRAARMSPGAEDRTYAVAPRSRTAGHQTAGRVRSP